jgi:subtilisin family serine protease
MKFFRMLVCVAVIVSLAQLAASDTGVNKDTQNDKASAKYGLTGKGVIVAILDRGIDYAHADFRNADGTTRIKMMWDMSNVNPTLGICDPGQPAPIVYTEAQINQALQMGTLLGERDAVGHGTVTAGLAAGNGRAVLPTSAQWAGLADREDDLRGGTGAQRPATGERVSGLHGSCAGFGHATGRRSGRAHRGAHGQWDAVGPD